MQTEVTTTKGNGLTTPVGAWGAEGASSKDLVVPRLQLVQATSDICKDGGARPGEIVNGQTKNIMAKKGESIDLLPILIVGSWVVSEPIVGARPKFLRMEALTPENDSIDWRSEAYENGRPVLRQKRLSVLSLPVNTLEGFPFWVDFQNTGRAAGQILSTIIQENKRQGRPAPARVISLGTTLKTREQNSWFVPTVTLSRDATEVELTAAYSWYQAFASKASEAALAEAPKEETPF